MTLIEEITSDDVLEQAFRWLCKQREHHSPNADVWWVRYHWQEVKADIVQRLRSGGGVVILFRLCAVMSFRAKR